MKTAFACAAIIVALGGSAMAEARYDKKLEEAVKARIAKKIGDLRSGFALGQAPEFIRLPEQAPTEAMAPPMSVPEPRPAPAALTLAVERKVSRQIF